MKKCYYLLTSRGVINLLLHLSIFVTSFVVHANAQTKIDSLIHQMKQLNLKLSSCDTNKINNINALSREYKNMGNYDSSLYYANSALQLSYDLLKRNVEKIQNSLLQQTVQKGIGEAYNNIRSVYHNKGNYPQALEYAFKVLKIYEEIKFKKGIASILSNIGLVYWNQTEYLKALGYYLKALKIAEEQGNKNQIPAFLGNIGLVYYTKADYPKALNYYIKALKLSEELGNKNYQASALGNIGNVYSDQGDSAVINGNIESALKDKYPKALEYYLKALRMDEKLGNKNGVARHLSNIGSLYTTTTVNLPTPKLRQAKFKEAEEYLKKAIAINVSIGAINDLMQQEKFLSELYNTICKYQLALIHYKRAMALKDTIFNDEKSKIIGKLEAKYEYELGVMKQKQEDEIRNREIREIRERKNLLQYSGILIFLVLLVTSFLLLARMNIPPGLVEGLLFFTFLLFFEFLLVLLDPLIESFTGGEPLYKLMINAGVALVIYTVHGFFEELVNKRLLKKIKSQYPSPKIIDSNFKNHEKRGKWKNIFKIFCMMIIFSSFVILNSSFENKSSPKIITKEDSLKLKLKFLTFSTLQKGRNPETFSHDTNLINTLNALAWELSKLNPDTSIQLSTSALHIAENLNFPFWKKGIAQSYHQIGWFNYLIGNYGFALENYTKALNSWKEINDKIGMAKTRGNIGIVYDDMGKYPKALENYFKAIKIDEESGNKDGISRHLSNIGIVYKHLGDYTMAIEYYLKALKGIEESGKEHLKSNILGNIGIVYYDKADYPNALDYFLNALKLKEKLGEKNEIAKTLTNIGNVYGEQGNYEKSLEKYKQALIITKETNDKNQMAIILGNIGWLLADTKKYEEAEKYIFDALKIEMEIRDLYNSETYLDKLSEIYEETGRYQLALLYYKKSIGVKDSLFNEEKSKDVGKLEAKHEYEMAEVKHKQIVEEQQRTLATILARRNKLQYSGILIFLVFLITCFLLLARTKIPVKLVEGVIFFTFLLFFEFLLVLMDPYIELFTGGEPLYKLMINAGVAIVIFPVHGFFEGWVKYKLIKLQKKNKGNNEIHKKYD